MADKLAGVVPAPLLEAVKDNVGQAIGIARELPEAQPFAAQIVDAANTSFVSGMHLAFTIAAGVTGVAALCVARFLPARAREELPPPGERSEEHTSELQSLMRT